MDSGKEGFKIDDKIMNSNFHCSIKDSFSENCLSKIDLKAEKIKA